jgi:hypothetical protein
MYPCKKLRTARGGICSSLESLSIRRFTLQGVIELKGQLINQSARCRRAHPHARSCYVHEGAQLARDANVLFKVLWRDHELLFTEMCLETREAILLQPAPLLSEEVVDKVVESALAGPFSPTRMSLFWSSLTSMVRRP